MTSPASVRLGGVERPVVREQRRRPLPRRRGSASADASGRCSSAAAPAFIGDSAMHVLFVVVVEHVRAIGGERQLEQRPGERRAGLDEARRTCAPSGRMRFSVRFMKRTISRTSQCDWCSTSVRSIASTASRSPSVRITTVPISGSLTRSRSSASSSSRKRAQRPELIASASRSPRACRRLRPGRRVHGQVRGALVAVEGQRHRRVGDRRRR